MNSWEQASFTAIQINNSIQNGTFVVPAYQRGYVWSDRQKDQFIDTLKRGLPFGTILLYYDEGNNQYQIIDGLQRCTTIYAFVNHPAPFFNEDDIDDDLPQKLAFITGIANPGSILSIIRDNLVNWVHAAFRSMDDVRGMQYYNYARAFISHFPSAQGKEMEIIEAVQPTLGRFKMLCENLCSVRIPAIIIKGDDDALPEIFERINSKGTQLSKYQIYAATWTKKYRITSHTLTDLVKYNKERYERMADDGADIADFNSITFMRERNLNLFEIAFALGKKLGDDYPSLFATKKDIMDVDSLGFSLITSCLGQKNSNSKNLYSVFDSVVGENYVNLFLERVIQCAETVQKFIGKFNKFKVNSANEVGPLHTEFQIISLIGNVFIARYAKYEKDDLDRLISFELNLDSSNSEWPNYEHCLKTNAWKRYCIDILNSRWKGSGDKKLDTVIYDTNYYAQSIAWREFENAATQWFNNSKLEKREYKRVTPPLEAEKLFLAILYLPVFSAQDAVDESKYDIEHLATKNLMKKCLDRYNGDLRLPIGSIGNLCLLPQKENRAKKDKTIYKDNRYLERSRYSLEDLEKKFTFTEKTDLEWIENTALRKSAFEQCYMQYIEKRFAKLLLQIERSYENM